MKKIIILSAIFLFCFVKAFSSTTIENQLLYVAGVIYAEAQFESTYCKKLVATTIWKRSKGNAVNIYKVCRLEKQFASPKYGKDEHWNECLKLSQSLYNNTFVPEVVRLGTGKIITPDHFFSGRTPWWAEGKIWKKVGRVKFLYIGEHKEID